MTYPHREDFANRDRWAADDRQRTSERYGADFNRTGICQRHVLGTDQAHQPCPVCGHADVLHGGYPNRGDPDLRGCLVCALKLLARPDPAPDQDHAQPLLDGANKDSASKDSVQEGP